MIDLTVFGNQFGTEQMRKLFDEAALIRFQWFTKNQDEPIIHRRL